ncbi:TPA: deoxynucleoside kinase [Vibrio parahaemolyticus]|uniref:deoxynucleoside kinase n=1 Tax=Vibrio parahaemolyticus TaxID=670 RepID=UPI00301B80D1|nr:deoxynucleoside kinase [Vibrio parahaemolyticus]HCM1516436.1 deoxynucleoside kinase [Vibrio parahaemolyticus]
MAYITLEGNIGVGKSTLLKRLAERLGWEAVEEGIEFDAGFQALLKQRYEDPSPENVAKLQLYIANFMAERINALDPNKNYVVERSVFATELFSLAAGRGDIIDAIAGHVLRVPPPLFYLYLSAPPEVCLSRIQQRDRDGESGISLDYLKTLHTIHEKWFHTVEPLGRAVRVPAYQHPDVDKLADYIDWYLHRREDAPRLH